MFELKGKTCWRKTTRIKRVLKYNEIKILNVFFSYIYIHIWYPLPPWRWGRGFIFQDQWGVYLFIWALGELLHIGHMGGVTIRNFPRGDSSTNFFKIGKCKSMKVNLTNCHREVCRIKFYQIFTSCPYISVTIW